MLSWDDSNSGSISMIAFLKTIGALPLADINNVLYNPVSVSYPVNKNDFTTTRAGAQFTVIWGSPVMSSLMPLLPFFGICATSMVMWASGHAQAKNKIVPAVLLLGSTTAAWNTGRGNLPFKNTDITLIDCVAMTTLVLVIYLAAAQAVTASLFESPSKRVKAKPFYNNARLGLVPLRQNQMMSGIAC